MDRKEPKNKLCLLRDIFRLVREFEISFQRKHDLSLNEGMAICSLKEKQMSSSDLATTLGLSTSNMSKVIKSIEDKGLVKRILGKEDRRQMYFILTKGGVEKLDEIQNDENQIDNVLSAIYTTRNLTTIGIH